MRGTLDEGLPSAGRTSPVGSFSLITSVFCPLGSISDTKHINFCPVESWRPIVHLSDRRARKCHGSERLGVEAADAPLFEALRAWRRERAAEQHVPPYVIFHDATLSAIARERPASAGELAKVSGVGQSKLKRYGADVLKVVRAN